MFDAIVFDAVRAAREYLAAHVTAKAAELLAAVAAASGGIKSVQRGYGASGTVTISAVNPAKAFVICGGAGVDQGYGGGGARLTSATTVQIAGGPVGWEVVEFK